MTVVFRTLKREFRVHCPDRIAADTLAFIEARPEVEGDALVPVDFRVERIRGFLRLSGPEGVTVEGSETAVLDDLFRIRGEAFAADHPAAASIVGAAVRFQGGHVLVTGDARAGKSVLAAYLAANGLDIATDGAFVLEPGYGAPLPMAIRLLDTDGALLPPGSAKALRRSPRLSGWLGQGQLSVSPAAFGRPWRVGPGPVRHLVVLRANHGGRSMARTLDTDVAFEMLLGQTQLPATRRVQALAALRSMVNAAQCWEVWGGRLDDILAMFSGWVALSGRADATAIGASL